MSVTTKSFQRQFRDSVWDYNGTWDGAALQVLMDIRDQLQALNAVVNCPNALSIPQTLRDIRKQLKLQRRCAKHPRYTGWLKPRVDCSGCRRLYKSVGK